jgi:hypothetical protein
MWLTAVVLMSVQLVMCLASRTLPAASPAATPSLKETFTWLDSPDRPNIHDNNNNNHRPQPSLKETFEWLEPTDWNVDHNNNNNKYSFNKNQENFADENTQGSYNPSYHNPAKLLPDQLKDKNFNAPPAATATTGGLPFLSYAFRGIAWLFLVGTLFLMFVGTVSAAYYRFSHRYVTSPTSGRDLNDITEYIYKAINVWNSNNN